MGNYKFRISDMIPNAWFHKLKDMTKTKTKPSSSSSNTCEKKKPSLDSLPHLSSTSYLSNSLVPNDSHRNSPRNSLHSKRMSKRKTLYKPSLKPFNPRHATAGFSKGKISGRDSSHCLFPALESSPESFVYSFYEDEDDDFVDPSKFKIDSKSRSFTHQTVKHSHSIEEACSVSKLLDKRPKSHLSVKINKEIEEEDEEDEHREEKKYQKQVSSGRKSSAGINLKRVNSPRIQLSGTRKSTSRSESKQTVLQSFAVMKRSVDPKKDFRESMVEMIEENNISASKDLEDLLACYLSLNPKENHDLIIQVFEQIWRQLTKTK